MPRLKSAPGADGRAVAPPAPASAALMRLRIRHLQLLDALDRLGSLRQVALELGLTQPAALSLIDDLEHAFGVPLVLRERSGTRLLPVAHAVLQRARIAVEEIAMAGRLATRGGATGGRLRVGASPYLISSLMPDVVKRLGAAPFAIEIDIREGTLDKLVAELVKGELDAVLGSVDSATVISASASLEATVLAAEPMTLAAGRGHPLYGRPRASLADLLAGPWVLPHASSHVRSVVDQALFDLGAAPLSPQVECRGILNLLTIAASAGLLTVAPATEIAKRAWRGRIAAIASPLALRAPPYAFVTRRYLQPLPEVVALRHAALEASRTLFGRAAGRR